MLFTTWEKECNMHIAPERSSQWMVEFDKQLVRGKQVLLYGSIADQFLLNGNYVPLHDFLRQYFVESGYGVVGQYDVVDGLQFSDPDEMRPTFESIVTQALGGQPRQEPPEADAASASPDGARRIPRAAMANARAATPMLQPPSQSVAAIREVIRQAETPAAFVLDFSDKLVQDPERQQEAERIVLVQLQKALREAAFISSGPLAGRRNALVMVAWQLAGVPPWFYQDNPFISLIQVGRPRTEERQAFLTRFIERFYGGAGLSPDQLEPIATQFADLTDGLSAWDLDGIRRTSIAEQIPISRTKMLVDHYKYGKRDDPWEHLDADRIRSAREVINERVIGQPAAVDAVVDMLVSARVGISMSEVTAKTGRPRGTFFFVGPTGVGKTELAKSLTELVFSDDTAFDRYDMSEYAEQHAAEKLTGSPPGYVGYDEGGRLTERMMAQPFSLLLFDEIEKAHGRVMDKFLQILEDGRLTNGKGQTAYFAQSVIIFTSNIGSSELDTCYLDGGELPDYGTIYYHFRKAVTNHFTNTLGRPELLNRLGDNILVFDMLRPEHIAGITAKFTTALRDSAREKRGLALELEQCAIAEMVQRLMLEGDNMKYGGRRIKTLVEATIERPLNRWVFFNNPPVGSKLHIAPGSDGRSITINGTPAQ
jgi:hypothetical protein